MKITLQTAYDCAPAKCVATLASACRHWRHVVVSDALLWRDIHIQKRDFPISEYLATCISRSKAGPNEDTVPATRLVTLSHLIHMHIVYSHPRFILSHLVIPLPLMVDILYLPSDFNGPTNLLKALPPDFSHIGSHEDKVTTTLQSAREPATTTSISDFCVNIIKVSSELEHIAEMKSSCQTVSVVQHGTCTFFCSFDVVMNTEQQN